MAPEVCYLWRGDQRARSLTVPVGTKAHQEFFLHIIERQHLWYNHTINLVEELTDYDPPIDVLVEPLEEGSPVVSVDESP